MPTEDRVCAFIARVEALDHGWGRSAISTMPTRRCRRTSARSAKGIDALLAGDSCSPETHGRRSDATTLRPLRHRRRHGVHQLAFRDGPGRSRKSLLDEVAMQVWDGDRIRPPRALLL